ncbi:response regulator transcription factor [Chloroflexota bacterium]
MNKNVLVIDPTASNSVSYTPLSNQGYSVDLVSDVDAGLQKLHHQSHDVIIIKESPDAKAWQVCEKIRGLSRIPLMVISPQASPETSARALQAGADYFIRKPFGPLEFVARVQSLTRYAALN